MSITISSKIIQSFKTQMPIEEDAQHNQDLSQKDNIFIEQIFMNQVKNYKEFWPKHDEEEEEQSRLEIDTERFRIESFDSIGSLTPLQKNVKNIHLEKDQN